MKGECITDRHAASENCCLKNNSDKREQANQFRKVMCFCPQNVNVTLEGELLGDGAHRAEIQTGSNPVLARQTVKKCNATTQHRHPDARLRVSSSILPDHAVQSWEGEWVHTPETL